MKKVSLIFGVLVCSIAIQAVKWQLPEEGTIVYEAKVNVHRTLPPDRKDLKDMVPEFNVSQHKLAFRGPESIYKPVEDEGDDEITAQGGGMVMRFRRPNVEYYVNSESGRKLRAQEFMGKKYLIVDSLSILPWKMLDGKKVIQGYECRQASYFNEERKQNIVVWYTDKLKPFIGPETYNTLPGTVLQVDINDGERMITAVELSFKPLKKNDLKVPSSGEEITEREFRVLMEEQMKRVNSQGGRMIIRN
jgi:GLPGLI family protein